MSALSLPVVACANPDVPTTEPSESASTSARVDSAEEQAHFSALERKYNARLGVYALATGTGAHLAHRADERFAFCSTFKTIAAAAVLQQHPLSYLDTYVAYTKEEVNPSSPIAQQ